MEFLTSSCFFFWREDGRARVVFVGLARVGANVDTFESPETPPVVKTWKLSAGGEKTSEGFFASPSGSQGLRRLALETRSVSRQPPAALFSRDRLSPARNPCHKPLQRPSADLPPCVGRAVAGRSGDRKDIGRGSLRFQHGPPSDVGFHPVVPPPMRSRMTSGWE